MRYQKNLLKFSCVVGLMGLVGCGVKGDPLPPERPPELGRGRTTYKKVTEKLKVKPTTPESEQEDADE
jgi:hypothetical protein